MLSAADDGREVGKSSSAREDIATVGRRIRGAGNLGVVGFDNAGGDVEKTSAGISNGIDGESLCGAGADSIARGGEFPEAVASFNVHICN